jgi:hypothetical protein
MEFLIGDALTIKGFHEVELGYSEIEFLAKVDRCLPCGMFPKKIVEAE